MQELDAQDHLEAAQVDAEEPEVNVFCANRQCDIGGNSMTRSPVSIRHQDLYGRVSRRGEAEEAGARCR